MAELVPVTRKGYEKLKAELDHLEQVLNLMSGSTSKRGRKAGKRTMSAAGKKAIAKAQKARWAKIHAEQKKQAKKKKAAAPTESE